MTKVETMECHPIDGGLRKEMGEGYCFYTHWTIKSENKEDDEEESRMIDWYIHPDGTFSGSESYYPDCAESEHYEFGGTFDKSKYDEIVANMKNFQTDWQKELVYDDDLFVDINEEVRKSMGCPKRQFIFDVSRYEEVFLNNE